MGNRGLLGKYMKKPNLYASRVDPRKMYKAYLKSGVWRRKRKLVLKRDDYTCCMCGKKKKKGMHVHHSTYKRLGDEDLRDLVVLCSGCHLSIHGKRHRRKSKYKRPQSLAI